MTRFRYLTAGLMAGLLPLAAQALCTSDRVLQPHAVLERFISADCERCWRDSATPRPGANTLVLDWIVPGQTGDKAPLAAVASTDAVERLQFLQQSQPVKSSAFTASRGGTGVEMRLAQGEAFNDYIGASIELAKPGGDEWWPWLLLVESLPTGTEGSPVARNLVRNVFRPDWHRPAARPPGRLADTRAMQIHAGARADRLRLVAVLHDHRGRIQAISQTECR